MATETENTAAGVQPVTQTVNSAAQPQETIPGAAIASGTALERLLNAIAEEKERGIEQRLKAKEDLARIATLHQQAALEQTLALNAIAVARSMGEGGTKPVSDNNTAPDQSVSAESKPSTSGSSMDAKSIIDLMRASPLGSTTVNVTENIYQNADARGAPAASSIPPKQEKTVPVAEVVTNPASTTKPANPPISETAPPIPAAAPPTPAPVATPIPVILPPENSRVRPNEPATGSWLSSPTGKLATAALLTAAGVAGGFALSNSFQKKQTQPEPISNSTETVPREITVDGVIEWDIDNVSGRRSGASSDSHKLEIEY